MKKVIWGICLCVSIGSSQFNLDRFVGEDLHYDVVWGALEVAEVSGKVSFVENDSSRMSVMFKSETVGWVKFIFDELDSIYSEFTASSGELIRSYRFARWDLLGFAPRIDEITITKDGPHMTYSFEGPGEESWQRSVVVDSNFSPVVDLGDMFSSGMVMRTLVNDVGDYHYFRIFGAIDKNLVPKLFPLLIEGEESIEIDGVSYETLKCRFEIVDTSVVFRDSKVVIWITNDYRRLPVQLTVTVTVPILGKEIVTVILNHEKSILPSYK
ncbi:DUF3108 domain-containing protein [Patescibacteria group bacterium AH-259-L05]|nr:DUF3108 domain-containing protein [Patescibacteria group bacterium AH-259-L05]